jgi:hypothetical protein
VCGLERLAIADPGGDLPVRSLLVGINRQEEVGPLLCELPKKLAESRAHHPGSARTRGRAPPAASGARKAHDLQLWRSRPDRSLHPKPRSRASPAQ